MAIEICKKIHETGVISIVRKIPRADILDTVKALCDGGIRNVEITMDSPKGIAMIEMVKDCFGDTMQVGAGTVLDPETARNAILAGADFILAPTLSTEMIEICNTYSKLAIPGVFTPTEALEAWKAGAQLVKVFPIQAVGPVYLKDMLGPLQQIRTLPVGGVSADNAGDYIRSGAYAVGIGSCLVNAADVKNRKYNEIAERAARIIKIVAAARADA